uniref:Uncharacterized protein n=1 Tax=Parascaris equorum TaxID=6256 RepID=A0A914S2I1_PAREQ
MGLHVRVAETRGGRKVGLAAHLAPRSSSFKVTSQVTFAILVYDAHAVIAMISPSASSNVTLGHMLIIWETSVFFVINFFRR